MLTDEEREAFEDIIVAREAAAEQRGLRKAIYEAALWCGECDPADPDDDCCVLAPRIRYALAPEATP